MKIKEFVLMQGAYHKDTEEINNQLAGAVHVSTRTYQRYGYADNMSETYILAFYPDDDVVLNETNQKEN